MSGAPPWLPLLLWPAGGAAAGVLLGVAIARPYVVGDVARPLVTLALLAATAYAAWRGGRAVLARRAARPRLPAAPAAAAPRADMLTAAVLFPDIPHAAPDVWGAGDALRVRATAARAGRAATGARVTLALLAKDGKRELARGALGADGALDQPLVLAEPGEVTLEARAEDGGETATALRQLRVVRYAAEVQHLFNEFRAWANARVPGCQDALTAREVADVVAPSAGARGAKALAEVARIYELVAYGEREADRGLYLALVAALDEIEAAGVYAKYAAGPRAEA